MPVYEIIYETGNHSLAEYADDAEATEAVTAHHERAVNGEPGGPTGHAAERVKRVLKYDESPAVFGAEQTLSTDEVGALLKEVDEKGVVNVGDLISKLWDALEPRAVDSGPHDSNYKMPESGELKLKLGA